MEESQGKALLKASKEGQVDVIKRILNDCHSNPDVVNFNAGGRDTTPLIAASQRDDIEVMELLISHGADIEAVNNYGDTALIAATWDGRTAAMEILLHHGAKIEAHNGVPLARAIRFRRIGAVEVLLRHGAEVKSRIAFEDFLLIRAVKNWDTNYMKVWLHQRCVYNERETFFQWAMRNGEYHIMNLLLQNGVELQARDHNGMAHLSWASHFNYIKAIEVLLRHGAQVDAKDNYGMTPLALACQRGNAEAVKILLENESSVHLKDNVGQIPLDHALLYLCSSHGYYGTRQGLSTVHLLLKCISIQT